MKWARAAENLAVTRPAATLVSPPAVVNALADTFEREIVTSLGVRLHRTTTLLSEPEE